MPGHIERRTNGCPHFCEQLRVWGGITGAEVFFHLRHGGHTHKGARNVRMRQAELEGQRRNISAMLPAYFHSPPACFADSFGSRMPVRRSPFGKEAHGKGRCVDKPDLALMDKWSDPLVHIRGQEIVTTIGEDRVHRNSFGNSHQHSERVPRDADKTGFSFLLQFAQRRDCFVDDLFRGTELDIVGLEKIYMVRSEATEGLFEAAFDAATGKIKFVQAIPPAFGRQYDLFAPAFESGAEAFFRKSIAIVRRDVKEVDPTMNGRVNSATTFFGSSAFEDVS